jgi:hypothetical protein
MIILETTGARPASYASEALTQELAASQTLRMAA